MAKNNYRSNPKARAALADALTRLSDDWLMCRDMRHAWHVVEDFHVAGQITGKVVRDIRRKLGCHRCGAYRVERYVMTRAGLEKSGQSYEYPDGYQIRGVMRGNKPSAMIHEEQYARAMNRVAKLSKNKEPRKAS